MLEVHFRLMSDARIQPHVSSKQTSLMGSEEWKREV